VVGACKAREEGEGGGEGEGGIRLNSTLSVFCFLSLLFPERLPVLAPCHSCVRTYFFSSSRSLFLIFVELESETTF
jgi:hypothetical protein